MKKQFVLVDETRRIVQVTTDDERFYIKESTDPITGLPTHVYLPSCTWICGYAPKGIGYYKWLADKGWDEAEAIKKERGKYGSTVHKAVELLLNGETVAMDSQFADVNTGELTMLTVEEYDAVLSFRDWWVELNAKHEEVEVVEVEYTIWNEAEQFAGTIDLILKVDGEYWIIDLKTSKNIWLSHELQVSAYKHSVDFDCRIAILQLGYSRNKNNYKFTEIEDKWVKFLAAREFWREENNGSKPHQKDYPLEVSLGMPPKQIEPEPVKKVKKPRAKKK